MTKARETKQRRLPFEILGLISISAFFGVILFLLLSGTGTVIVETYCFRKDIVLTELEWMEADRWICGISGLLSLMGFSLLFLALLGDRMAYIRTITEGIHDLQSGKIGITLPLEGRNELTHLAASINDLSETQQKLRQKEETLAREKDQFIRSLSHDIRTPLTSILAYSEYLEEENSVPQEEQKQYLQMIRKKAEQIRDLSALLLDGDKRSVEYFDNAKLLMEQLAAEFEEDLEDRFCVQIDLSGCGSFGGSFDVQELRRIFDNLSSNVQKYAAPKEPVLLDIRITEAGLCIRQQNGVLTAPVLQDSYKLGINSIRRIAQNYGGWVDVLKDANKFCITVTLSEY